MRSKKFLSTSELEVINKLFLSAQRLHERVARELKDDLETCVT